MLVTEEMIKAGQDICDLLMNASIAKCMGGLGGSQNDLEIILAGKPNRDLVEDYINERILSVTAIYIAMDRARK